MHFMLFARLFKKKNRREKKFYPVYNVIVDAFYTHKHNEHTLMVCVYDEKLMSSVIIRKNGKMELKCYEKFVKLFQSTPLFPLFCVEKKKKIEKSKFLEAATKKESLI